MTALTGSEPAPVSVDEWITMQAELSSARRQLRQNGEAAAKAAEEWRVEMDKRDAFRRCVARALGMSENETDQEIVTVAAMVWRFAQDLVEGSLVDESPTEKVA